MSPTRQAARRSRRKGREGENDFVREARAAGFQAEVVRGTGGPWSVKGDVYLGGLRCEVKQRKSVPLCLYRWLAQDGASVLAVRRDGHGWLMVLPLDKRALARLSAEPPVQP